jgi:uncharacterized protein YdhG (YjbR/CyaY superfamily)
MTTTSSRRRPLNARPTDIDAYLATVPEDARAALEDLRRTIKVIVPDAVESISYGVPTFKYRGRPLAYFGAAKNHCALYGMNIEAHRDALAAYDTSKGTIRFQPNNPLPDALVQSLVVARMTKIESAATARRKKPSAKPSP